MGNKISRRQALQGLAALTAGALLPSAAQGIAVAEQETVPYPPSLKLTPGAAPVGIAAVNAAVKGVGCYVGNQWLDWSETARRYAMARVRDWGFDFICPKVGGYGMTWYQSPGQLAGWSDSARAIGLTFVPFIYSVPDTYASDARICAELARTVGIAVVDMEDEWGAKEGSPPGYKGAEMAEFGRIYREQAGDLPIVVTGYGDPITRFGPAGSGFPNAEMAAWMDAYSPQWYIGVYSRYHKNGVKAALDWGKDECIQALGAGFPICPSVDLSCLWTTDHRMPLSDVLEMMAELAVYNAPVFAWEYAQITGPHAEALLGPPAIGGVRLDRGRQKSFSVAWDTQVPARASLTCKAPDGTVKNAHSGDLQLTQSVGLNGLTPGTAYLATIQASTGAGASPAVPLTVATAPATDGVYIQSAALAAPANSAPSQLPPALGHVAITLAFANSGADAQVSVTGVSIDGGTLLSPASWPVDIGTVAGADYLGAPPASTTLTLAVIPSPNATQLTAHVSCQTAAGPTWTATLPVALV